MRWLQPGGYGSFVWPNPPLGARAEALHARVVSEGPDEADWSVLLKAGYRRARHLTIDGIPVLFSEFALVDVFGRPVGAPADYTVAAALSIPDSIDISQDADREKGLAAGRTLDFTLAWNDLEAGGFTSLFRVPALSTPLTTTIATATATSFPVLNTVGFQPGIKLYVGHECIEPAGLADASFEGVRRAICGPAHYHTSQTGSGYRYVTDSPMFWRGRLLTLWEHLVSPDGYALGGDYATIGPYVRQAWKGYLDEEPKSGDEGIILRALPLQRMLSEEIGIKVQGEVSFDSNGFPFPLVVGAADLLAIEERAGSGLRVSGPDNAATLRWTSLATWCALVNAHIKARSGLDIIKVEPVRGDWKLQVKCIFNGESAHDFTALASAWFLDGWIHEGRGNTSSAKVGIPLNFNSFGRVTWLPVRFEVDEEGSATDVPESGTAVIEVNGDREIVTWDAVVRLPGADDSQPMALRLVGRSPSPSPSGPRTLDWSLGGTVTIASGGRGPWSEVFRAVVTSSGLGDRGPFDRLGAGFGHGLSEEHIDLPSLSLVTGPDVDAFAEGKASVAEMLLGWCALQSLCVVQRRGADGVIRLAVVSTEPREDATARVIGPADVLLDGHKKTERLQAPNQVEIEAGTTTYERDYIVRDRARQVGEKVTRSWTLKAPGVTESEALALGGGLMRLSEGQDIQEIEVPPWVEVQIGDSIVLTTEHPTLYDWISALRAPDARAGVVVGVGQRAGWTRATLLLSGYARDQSLLCPSPVITHAVSFGSDTAIRILNDDGDWFEVGDEVRVYTPGFDASAVEGEVIAKTIGETETVLVVAAPFSVSVGVTRVTYAAWADATTKQRAFMYTRADRFWR